MLHLLTSQVTYRKTTNNPVVNASEQESLTEQNVKLEHDNSEWLKYNKSIF